MTTIENDTEEKDYFSAFWPKSIIKKFKDIDSVEELAKLCEETIKDKRLNIKQQNENLEDDVLRFKSFCLSHRTHMREVYSEEEELLYKMWEDLDKKTTETRNRIKDMSKEISKVSSSVGIFKKELSDLHIYGADRLLELANTINNMDQNTKDILRHVLSVNKKT